MIRNLIVVLLFTISFKSAIYSQNDQIESLNRYHNEKYRSFREYLQHEAIYPPDAVENGITGVLLAGIILDNTGKIINVFSLNSLWPSIDESVLDLLASSEDSWGPKKDHEITNKNDIIILPIVYCFGKLDYIIDRENSKLLIAQEVVITVFGLKLSEKSIGSQKTNILLEDFHELVNKESYQEAYQVLVELLKREPLNVYYYLELVKLESQLGNNVNACQNLKFIKSNFKVIPDLVKTFELNCN